MRERERESVREHGLPFQISAFHTCALCTGHCGRGVWSIATKQGEKEAEQADDVPLLAHQFPLPLRLESARLNQQEQGECTLTLSAALFDEG